MSNRSSPNMVYRNLRIGLTMIGFAPLLILAAALSTLIVGMDPSPLSPQVLLAFGFPLFPLGSVLTITSVKAAKRAAI